MCKNAPGPLLNMVLSIRILLVMVGIAQSGMSCNIMDKLPNGSNGEDIGVFRQEQYSGVGDTILKASGKGKQGDDYLFIEMHFPQNIGNKELDQSIKQRCQDYFQALTANIGPVQSRGDDDRLSPVYIMRCYYIFRPSKDYVSIVYYYFQSSCQGHTYWAYEPETYNLTTGKQIQLQHIFLDFAKSEPLFWDYFYKKWSEKYADLPTLFSYDAPQWRGGPQKAKAPEGHDFSHHIILNEYGMAVIYGPYASGSFTPGTRSLDIPKDDLFKLGADPSIWGQYSYKKKG